MTSAKLDGNPIGVGGTIDGFFLAAGKHTISVSATDLAGNSTSVTTSFQVNATITGLYAAVTRAKGLGLISTTQAKQLQDALTQAQDAQQKGKWKEELAHLADAEVILIAFRGRGIDPTFDSRAAVWVLDLAEGVAAPHVAFAALAGHSISALTLVIKHHKTKKAKSAKHGSSHRTKSKRHVLHHSAADRR